MMRDCASVRLTWSVGWGPSVGDAGGLPLGFLPVAAALASRVASLASYPACSRLIPGLLALEAFPGTGLDHRARLGQLLQALLTPGQLVWDRQAVGVGGLVSRL